MKLAKIWKMDTLWLYVLAFFAARAEVAGGYPFAIAIYVAAYLADCGSWGLYGIIVLGIGSTLSIFSAIRYGVIIMLITIGICLLTVKKESNVKQEHIHKSPLLISGAAAVLTALYGVMYQAFFSDISQWYLSVLEGVLVLCFSVILHQALSVIRNDDALTESENILSTLVLLAIVLWGIPLQVASWFTVLQGVVYYLILFLSYRYGIAYGTSVGAICGVVLAIRMQQVEWVAICVILGLAASFLGEWSKMLELAGFIGLIGFLGFFYYPQMLEVQALRGFVSAGVLYLCTPKSLMLKKRAHLSIDHSDNVQEQLQLTLQQRLQEYAKVFHKIGASFDVPRPAYASASDAMMGMDMASDVESGNPDYKCAAQTAAYGDAAPIFEKQLMEIGNSLREFSDGVSTVVPMEQNRKNALIHCFEREHVRVRDIVMVKGMYGRKELYMSARTIRGRVMTTKEAAELISRELKTGYRVSTNSRMIINQEYDVIVFEEDTRYRYLMGARRHTKDGQTVSGDNFSQMELQNGQLLMMLADGMGSGVDASEQSEQLVDLLEEMLEAGFKKETAIEILNELLTVKSQGETFATLDLCMVDLYTGVGEFLKMGASATFIKRGSWIETIQSTSLPIGVKEQTEIDAIQKKFYHGDMIVMVSDGLLDGIIFENKEECLKEILLEIATNNPQELADELIRRVQQMNIRGMRDDASVLVLGLWKKQTGD